MENKVKRLSATEQALDLIIELQKEFGDLMYWKNAHFELDVIDGFGVGGFSLEAPKGKTFKVNYQLFTKEELELLEDIERFEHS